MSIVVVHPDDKHPYWAEVVADHGDTVTVRFQIVDTKHTFTVPKAHVLDPGPSPYPNDGIGDYYWRKDQEIKAERLAWTPGTPFTPQTFID